MGRKGMEKNCWNCLTVATPFRDSNNFIQPYKSEPKAVTHQSGSGSRDGPRKESDGGQRAPGHKTKILSTIENSLKNGADLVLGGARLIC